MATTKKARSTVPTTNHKAMTVKDIQKGDIFSEISHYQFTGIYSGKGMEFMHTESKELVYLNEKYVLNLLTTPDFFTTTEKVGREDKLWTAKQIADAVKSGEIDTSHTLREGDVRIKGIRTIFEEIYEPQVFLCEFRKQDERMSDKKLADLRQDQLDSALAAIVKAQKGKDGVANEAKRQLIDLQTNPILPITPGEVRLLRGYKVQFTSRDGRYNCVDMDIDISGGGSNLRPVNINTLIRLVYKGTEYIVE